MGAVGKIFAGIGLIVAGIVLAPFTGGLSLQLVAIGATIALQGVIQAIRGNQSTKVELGKVNVRLPEPTRWLAAGTVRLGGAVLFAEFDTAGNLWMVIVHGDSILTEIVKIYMDDILVTLDGSGNVTTDDFCLDSKKNQWSSTSTGAKSTFIQLFTTTYSESNPTPPAIAALATAFPSKWTADHKLVGTTYSVMKMKTIDPANRYKVYKWRGPLGLGEPSVSIVGKWSHAYDPRDNTQSVNDATTHRFTRNSVLMWAWFRTHRYGRAKARSSIDWERVAEQAAICDQTVTGLVGTHVRYQCDIAIPDDQARIEAEQAILMTMDAQLVFSDDGRCWPRVGYYYAPTLALTRNRDIVAMESIEAQNGESETQGVIVRYTDPAARYTPQPAAAWYNPIYYVPGEAATFLTVDILACTDHNQAVRLAKAIGMRSQPAYKIAPTAGLRGLSARRERIVNLQYDNVFAGDHEITSQVEVDQNGIFCAFAAVPVDPNRWTLLAGEERPKPVVDAIDAAAAPTLPTGVTIAVNNNRIEATFTPSRADIGYEFQYILTSDIGSGAWADMTVQMVDGFAYSPTIVKGASYSVRYRAIAGSGRVSAWSTPTAINVDAPTNVQLAIFNSWIIEVAAGTPVVSVTSAGVVTIDNHTRRYPDGYADKAVTGATLTTGLAAGSVRSIGYDDPDRLGGAVTYALYVDDNDAHASAAHPGRHYCGFFTVPASGSTGGGGGGIGGGGPLP